MNVTVATFNTEVLAIQNGTEVVTGSTPITYYDVIEADGGKYKTKFTATGTADNEIKFVYIVGADGTYSKTYKQAATATGTGTFSYDSGTKEITFGTDAPAAGDMICLCI